MFLEWQVTKRVDTDDREWSGWNCVNVTCCVVLEMCYSEYVINVKVLNVIL